LRDRKKERFPVQPELQSLIRLQLIDDGIARFEGELEKIPRMIESEKTYLDDFGGEVKAAEAEIKAVQKSQRDAEGEIQASDQKLRDSRGKQTLVKNNNEYRALTQEIESFQKEILELEDKVLECMEAVEPLQKKMEESKKGLDKARDTVTMALKRHEDSRARIDHELEKLQRERQTVWDAVSPDWRKRYEVVRKGWKGQAVVPIVERTCRGCHMSETIQRFFEIRDSEEEIYSCSNCGRIVYYQEAEAVSTAGPAEDAD
jgi:predicted  nucleic acid-binding Zn-ribbon protein